jgi:H+/Cl- antiporter ClcA
LIGITNYREHHSWLLFLLPFGGLLIGFSYHYYGKSIAGGNNLLFETIREPRKKIPFKMAPFVLFGTLITHFFGGSAGREGTALQMAGGIADQFSLPLKFNKSDRKILLLAAIAAGFGSVFGTPLAGALFALEVVFIGNIRHKAVFPVFVSAILADLVTDFWGVQHTPFSEINAIEIGFLPIIYSITVGIAFGLCAAIFCKTQHYMTQFFKDKIAFPPLRPFVGGVLIVMGVLVLGTAKYIGLGIPTLLQSFDNQMVFTDFVLKMVFTILTLSSGFKGGEVTPLFFIGATLGSALSLFIPLPTALLAGMGFVAIFAGATNTPLASLIMSIELFGVENAVYMAIVCLISYLVSGHNSIYDKQIIGKSKYHHFSFLLGERIHNRKVTK